MLESNHAVCAVQYMELAFEIYAGWYCYAAVLYFISIASCFLGVRALYVKRLELFKTIQQQHIMPVVSKGRVRQVVSGLSSIQCFATCMQPHRCHLYTWHENCGLPFASYHCVHTVSACTCVLLPHDLAASAYHISPQETQRTDPPTTNWNRSCWRSRKREKMCQVAILVCCTHHS